MGKWLSNALAEVLRLGEELRGVDCAKFIDSVGSDRVLFGFDSPFHEPSVEIEKTRATHLPEDALRRIYPDNTAKLLDFDALTSAAGLVL